MRSLLYPKREIEIVIGSICKNPSLLRQTTIELKEDDFCRDIEKIVFKAINNIIYVESKVVGSLSGSDIDVYLSKYPAIYESFNKHNGLRYVDALIKKADNEDMFQVHYNRIKKISVLRNYQNAGIDIGSFLTGEDEDNISKKIDASSIGDILDHFSLHVAKLRELNLDSTTNIVDFKASDGLDDLLDRLQDAGDIGYLFDNDEYNNLFKGMRKGKLLLRGANSGNLKTRSMLRDMINVSCSEIYNLDTCKWDKLDSPKPCLMISTELQQTELQCIMLAILSGIDSSVIEEGTYDVHALERIKHAQIVLKKAPLYFSYISDFSLTDIETKIETYILTESVEYIAFDYIQLAAKLSRTMQESYKIKMREDQILVNFTEALKNIATKYQVFIETSTQLNRGSKEVENMDASAIRGSYALSDKVDYGVLVYTAKGKHLENVAHIAEELGCDMPNRFQVVFKNRAGQKDIILWSKINGGNMREKHLFATDTDYNLIKLKKLEFVVIQGNVTFDERNLPF